MGSGDRHDIPDAFDRISRRSYRSFENVSYDEFDFDKRRDVIVRFALWNEMPTAVYDRLEETR